MRSLYSLLLAALVGIVAPTSCLQQRSAAFLTLRPARSGTFTARSNRVRCPAQRVTDPGPASSSNQGGAWDQTGFFCPFETFGVDQLTPRAGGPKPVLLYLPGLEGSGLTAFVQYPDLASMFELRCLSIPNSDRSTFKELIDVVHDQIKSYRGRDLFIMGESFGGLLALGTILDATKKGPNSIKGVILVNPATSFSRTVWAKLGRYITRLPTPLYTLSMLPIGMLLVDGGQIQSLLAEAVKQVLQSLQVINARVASNAISAFHLAFYKAALPVMIQRLEMLPPGTLDWRMLQWLTMGSEMVEPQLHRIAAPVLVVAGTVDRLLPSFEEAKRLQKELPKCTVHYAKDMGHGGTLDQRTNLTQILSDWRPVQNIVTVLPLSGSSTPNNDFSAPAFRT